MLDPSPVLTERLCAIFREWSVRAEHAMQHVPDSDPYKGPTLSAARSLAVLGQVGAIGQQNMLLLNKPAITYGKIEFMARLLESMPPGPRTAQLQVQIREVREWLPEQRPPA